MLRIGIDVGGTNTDAVVMDGSAVLSTVKSAATQDVTSGIRAAMDDAMEVEARDYLLTRQPDLRIVLSTEIGRIGLLERENAAIMNAALLELADRTVSPTRSATSYQSPRFAPDHMLSSDAGHSVFTQDWYYVLMSAHQRVFIC